MKKQEAGVRSQASGKKIRSGEDFFLISISVFSALRSKDV
jgi:hypothetical protein